MSRDSTAHCVVSPRSTGIAPRLSRCARSQAAPRLAGDACALILAAFGLRRREPRRGRGCGCARLDAERWRALLPPVRDRARRRRRDGAGDDCRSAELRASWHPQARERRLQREGGATLGDLPELDGEAAYTAPRRAASLPVCRSAITGSQSPSAHIASETALIVAPRACHLPRELQPGGRSWGLTAQLYGLRSRAQLGHRRFHRSRLRWPPRAARQRRAPRSASIRCTRCLPPSRAISAPIRRRAALFLNPLYIDVDGGARTLPKRDGAARASPAPDAAIARRAAR